MKCKDCPSFRYAGNSERYNGLCFEQAPPWAPMPVNGEWDDSTCPFVQDYIESDEGEWQKECYRKYVSSEKGE